MDEASNTIKQNGAGSSPDAVAWRLSAVESEVKEVRSELTSAKNELLTKLDKISGIFATYKDVEAVQSQSKLEHEAIYEKISDVEQEVSALKKRNWVQNTLSAILGSVLTLLIGYAVLNILNQDIMPKEEFEDKPAPAIQPQELEQEDR